MTERYETFTALIAKISRSIRKIKNNEMAEYRLRSPHISCLYYLYLEEGLTATELCEKCEEDKAAVSRSLDYLESSGYIVRDNDRPKRYKSPLYLSDKGRDAGRRVTEKIDGVLIEVGLGMSDGDREAFYQGLRYISSALENIAGGDRQ